MNNSSQRSLGSHTAPISHKNNLVLENKAWGRKPRALNSERKHFVSPDWMLWRRNAQLRCAFPGRRGGRAHGKWLQPAIVFTSLIECCATSPELKSRL